MRGALKCPSICSLPASLHRPKRRAHLQPQDARLLAAKLRGVGAPHRKRRRCRGRGYWGNAERIFGGNSLKVNKLAN